MDAAPDPRREAEGEANAADISAARQGDQDAFDRLVQRYQRRAVSVAYRLLGSIHDAADVAQDAFLRAYQNLEKLDDPRRFGPWMLRIVTNLALNFRRSRGRTSALSMEDVVEGEAPLRTASGATPAGGGSEGLTELESAVAKAMDELPEKQRMALVLFSMEGIPQKQVAEIMDCSVELVKWNVFQARKSMKRALADFIG